jgi:hypothetical protein
MRNILFIFCLCFLMSFNTRKVYSKEYRLGGSLVYNFKAKGLGMEGRAEFPVERIKLLEGISIVPQLSYFPSSYDASEIDIGSSVHLGVYKMNKWIFYGLVNASYRVWLNVDEADEPDPPYRDMALESGVGVTRKTCLRPFFEFRLNFIGMEPAIRAGILYTIHCDRRGMVPCSKIPPEPQF